MLPLEKSSVDLAKRRSKRQAPFFTPHRAAAASDGCYHLSIRVFPHHRGKTFSDGTRAKGSF